MAKKEKKPRSPEHVGFKEIFGATALSTNNGLAAIFMSTMFMNYMTDYAGLGSWGATLATTLLLAARIVDAVDDPVQGAIMDGAKVTKHGKYKPFFLLSIIMTGIGVIAMYSLPDAVTKTPWLVAVWVIFFYFCYDIGASFYNQNLLFRTMTNDPEQRSKLLIGPRLWVMVLGIIGSAMGAITVSIQAATGSFKTAYMILAAAAMGISCVLSFIGWLMVNERHVIEQEEDEKVKLTDLIELVKTNKPMLVQLGMSLFGGFIWNFAFAAPTYYIKYAYCVDPVTGAFDAAKFGTYGMIAGMMNLFPLVLGTIIATPMLKAFKGDFIKMTRFDFVLQGIACLAMFIGQITGIMKNSPIMFFVCLFVLATFIGTDFIPGSNLGMEAMDYTIYKTGKDRSALTAAFGNFLAKAQGALSSAAVGAILIAIGYNVNSASGDFAGDMASIPTMLNWLMVVMGLFPALMALGTILMSYKYPIDNEERKKIQEYITEHQSHKVEE